MKDYNEEILQQLVEINEKLGKLIALSNIQYPTTQMPQKGGNEIEEHIEKIKSEIRNRLAVTPRPRSRDY
jgi:hypothetical protein